jgi:hypothetical protein
VGHAWLDRGRRREALDALERAVAIFDARPPLPGEGAPARFYLSVALGKGERARKLAGRALADLDKTGMEPLLRRKVVRWLRALPRPAGAAAGIAEAAN